MKKTGKLIKSKIEDAKKAEDVAFLKTSGSKTPTQQAARQKLLQIDLDIGAKMEELESLGVKFNPKKGFILPKKLNSKNEEKIRRGIKNLSLLLEFKKNFKI